EFLWQEGHTAHATEAEAWEETRKMLDVYADFAENYMAMPVFTGEKTAGERFPGAVSTLCIEALMQDRKALQAGTSHFLGQNFAKASGIKFQSEQGVEEFAWTTSWGVSTRLIGGMIMTHGDDNGMVVPPRLAPNHIVILPVVPKEESRAEVTDYCNSLREQLKGVIWDGRPLEVLIDNRDIRGGEKAWHWVKKGIPLRIEIGPRDVAAASVFFTRRDSLAKATLPRADFVAQVGSILDDIQRSLFERAKAFRDDNLKRIDSKEEFYAFFTPKNAERPEIHGGFAFTHWDGSDEVADKISEDLKVTIRCIPFNMEVEPGVCPFSGRPSKQRVLWAKSY
ncbi:MAG: His/Gly/Thr/Pro-type tRNA ligase C-terminal domain-containing protein, partial [Opitutales bacterium]